MTSDPDSTTQTGDVSPGRGRLKDWVNLGTITGATAGGLIGLWAANNRALLEDEKTVLLAVLGAAVGVLAVALTAMTLVIVFLTDRFLGPVIRDLNVRRFFRPFVVTSIVSAAAALVSLVAAIDSTTKAERLKDSLFGLSVGLLAWAILSAVRLVTKLVQWATTLATITRTRQAGDESKPQQIDVRVEVQSVREIIVRLLEAIERRPDP